jgi:hypothetical protein
LWREGFMAQSVLLGNTKGYRNHPQLERFRSCDGPVAAIGSYLRAVYQEACRRGYSFDESKVLAGMRRRSASRLPMCRWPTRPGTSGASWRSETLKDWERFLSCRL